jgi:hypothetical protein
MVQLLRYQSTWWGKCNFLKSFPQRLFIGSSKSVLRYGKTLGCELHGNVASYFLVFFFSFVFDKSSFSWHFFKTGNPNYLFQKVALKFHSCRK